MKPARSVGNTVITFLLILMGILMFIPFWQIIVITFSGTQDYLTDPTHLILRNFDAGVIGSIMKTASLQRGIFTSIGITAAGLLFSMFLTLAGAYPLAHKQLPGRKVVLTMMIVTMYFNGGIISMYVLLRRLDILNTYAALVLPYAVNTFYLMLVKNYMTSLSPEMEEAAKIDGCNDIQILVRIIAPLCKPVLLTVGMFYVVYYWNDYFSAMMYIDSNEMYPLSLILRNVVISREMAISSLAAAGGSNPTEQYTKAMILVSMLPVLALYPFIQRYFTSGIMVGALKD